jgi:hypothetical protein
MGCCASLFFDEAMNVGGMKLAARRPALGMSLGAVMK